MISKCYRVLIGAALLAFAIHQEGAAQQSVTIEGQVLDPGGRPVGGFTVTALDPVSGSAADAMNPQSDGAFRLTVPAGVYVVVTGMPPQPLLPARVRVDARRGNLTNLILRLTAQTPLVPDDPPRASLIQVSTPDAKGDATVSGAAGAVAPGSFLVLVTLDTGHAVTTQARDDGSFRASLFAPSGTSILIKADPFGLAFRSADIVTRLDLNPNGSLMAGTIVRVPEPPAGGGGVLFGRAGLGQDVPPQDPAWTFQGALASQTVAPGGTLQIDGTVRIVSTALQQAGPMRLVASVRLDKVSASDGSGSLAQNMFASTLLTPTGLPIERERNGRAGDGLMNTVRVDLTKTAPDRAEAPVQFALKLPDAVPPGFYVPVTSFFFEGLPVESPPSRLIVLIENKVRREHWMTYLPVVRVGNPAPPRIPAMLLAETLSNGTRGVRAVEDRSRFSLASRLRMDETFIVPRLDKAGEPLTYRLEPFLPTVSVTVGGRPNLPLIPFRFPSGRLTVRIEAPDGSMNVIGLAPFVQPRLKSNGLLGTSAPRDVVVSGGAFTLITECYQLSTLDPRFEVTFAQDGRHLITLDGAIGDIWGNTWMVGGTYEVNVARLLSVDTAVVPGTPFEVGDVFSPAVVVTPALPADIEVRVRLAPNSDPTRMIEREIRGRANRFGYFDPRGSGVVFDQPGEYRVDVVASFTDAQGSRWTGTRTWGSVVAPRDTPIIAHGRRGMVNTTHLGSQWFFRTQTPFPTLPHTSHPNPPFHSGDVFWAQKSDTAFVLFTFQDPGALVTDLLRTRQRDSGVGLRDPGTFDERAPLGELPLFSTRADGTEPHIDPSRVDLWGYTYRFVERPMIAVREVIGEDSITLAYWPFDDHYGGQMGIGGKGDLPNDFKFYFGGVVLRGAAIPQPLYAIYGSLFVLVSDDDPGGGTRIFPPFQGNGGGPSGGALFNLKSKQIDIFFHPTGTRPGSILERGNVASFAGQIGPPLSSKVEIMVTSPSGRLSTIRGQANKVGYFYQPSSDFRVDEEGVWRAKVKVFHDDLTSAGQVTPPFPTGDVLGSREGEFLFYVVSSQSPQLEVNIPRQSFVRPGEQPVTITITPPAGWSNIELYYTTVMPGFVLEEGKTTNLTYVYDAVKLNRDFPNLDLPAADTITMSFLVAGADITGKRQYFARQVLLQGEELLTLEVAPLPPRHRPVRR